MSQKTKTNADAERQIPTLPTERLVLRPFGIEDGPRVQQLAGEREIADTTLSIPHPYEDGVAVEWIATHAEQFAKNKHLTLAVTLAQTGELVGAISLAISPKHARAELGYWIGRPYWGGGYCTEAAAAIVRYGFEQLGLNRVTGWHLRRNPASGKVMEKIGMSHEGVFRQHVRKWDVFEDLEHWGLLKDDWQRGR